MLPGPQAEPGTSLPAAAASPRLRLGSQRGSAWAAAAGSPRVSAAAAERGAGTPERAGSSAPVAASGLSSLSLHPPSAEPRPQKRAQWREGEKKKKKRAATWPAARAAARAPRPRRRRPASRVPGRAPLLRAARQRLLRGARLPRPESLASRMQTPSPLGSSPDPQTPAGGSLSLSLSVSFKSPLLVILCIICLLRLIYFTYQNALQVHICCHKWQDFLYFHGQIILYYIILISYFLDVFIH